ncbi:methionyl-tRNA formyltransferase [Lapillicoccus sp.]|uniref:methionyl-tRNA formyltransferase n=1 Tax=Lapillicoccus sp. TaxID=1909287 RepID=UPI0039834FE4
MRLVLAGTPAVAIPSLDALASSSHDVVAVVTRPDAPAGRGRSLVASPVRGRAEELGIPVLTPTSPKDNGFQRQLRDLAPDVCPVVAYGALIPGAALDIPVHGWVNLHFSLLPAWRGAAPVQRAIMAGDEVTGASTFLIEEGLDTGPVFGIMTETIRAADTSGELLSRLGKGGAGLLLATLDGIESGDLVAKPQPAEGISVAPKLGVDDARIDWTRPAGAVDRLVRGCTPAPGAWTTFRGERLKVNPVAPVGPADLPTELPAEVLPDSSLASGQLLVTKKAVFVGTGSRPVRLGTVQPHGKKPMAAADWARGVRIETAERFTNG